MNLGIASRNIGLNQQERYKIPRAPGAAWQLPRDGGRAVKSMIARVWTGHAVRYFVHPSEFMTFLRQAARLDLDVMLEAKSNDLR
jgi:hypothetical protein